jgi:sulfhydrogenase subunit gamma (sulfur reductase)
MVTNIYLPELMRIEDIVEETPDTRTLRLVFLDEKKREEFAFHPGQFGLFSVFGEGESTFCIASPPTWKGYIECCFRRMWRVTSGLRRLDVGYTVGFRGPYGNHFPIEEWKGKNLLFIAGGIGFPPLRTVIWNVLDEQTRADYRDITIVYGARTVADLVYKRELAQWEARADVNLYKTVDPGGETPDWNGRSGFVPAVLDQVAPSSENTVALVCGPPIMIKFTFPVLAKLGFPKDRIYTTLENRMKCGLGKCGRCNVGSVYVCKEGPVFTAAQLDSLPPEY